MLTCSKYIQGPSTCVCESCIHWNVREINTPEGKIGQFVCTTSGCDNGTKFKLRTPELEAQERARHESW